MPTSGTISNTVFETRVLIDRAYGRCRLRPQQITDGMIDRAQSNLYLILSDMSNTGTPVWCLQKQMLTLTQGQPALTLPVGTVDVRNAFLRRQSTLIPDSGPVISSGSITFNFSVNGAQLPNSIGITWTSTPIALTLQTSPDNSFWTTVASVSAASGTGLQWIDTEGASQAIYWRLIPSGTGTISASSVTMGYQLSEIMLGRLNADSYESYPNKASQGTPLQFFLDRQLVPIMRLWASPDAASALLPMVVYRQRYIMDVGTLPQTIEVPQYWYDPIVWKLSATLAWETPECDAKLIPMLEQKAEQSMRLAWNQDRDKSPISFKYAIGAYTR